MWSPVLFVFVWIHFKKASGCQQSRSHLWGMLGEDFFFVDGAFWNAGYSLWMVERITFCWQQEVKSNCSCGWQKLSQNADVHQYLAESLPDILSDRTQRPSWNFPGLQKSLFECSASKSRARFNLVWRFSKKGVHLCTTVPAFLKANHTQPNRYTRWPHPWSQAGVNLKVILWLFFKPGFYLLSQFSWKLQAQCTCHLFKSCSLCVSLHLHCLFDNVQKSGRDMGLAAGKKGCFIVQQP